MVTLEVQTLGEYLAFQESLISFPEVQHVPEDQSFKAESRFSLLFLKGRGRDPEIIRIGALNSKGFKASGA